ncbi:25171_t:CDS:2 [Gigaspora margarita]|uniref:25171_t:CDS:1 n=1 Tax=Gigaspora margarita TaxID=4874 RepID=A0ABM8VWT3_GIGMA|nr:25171_t:CDS:2 [Gigaspora margarita]
MSNSSVTSGNKGADEVSEREVISVLILKSEFYDGMIEAYKEWLRNEENDEDDETKLHLIDDIVKLVQEREFINSMRQKFGFNPIELGDQSIKVGSSEKEVVFENKEIYDNIIMEYESWFFLEQIETKGYYLRLFELIEKKENEDNFAG